MADPEKPAMPMEHYLVVKREGVRLRSDNSQPESPGVNLIGGTSDGVSDYDTASYTSGEEEAEVVNNQTPVQGLVESEPVPEVMMSKTSECAHIKTISRRHRNQFASNPGSVNLQPTCSVCHRNDDLWMCLACGVIACGRLVNGHALAHAKDRATHAVMIHFTGRVVFCHQCDENVNITRSHRLVGRLLILLRRFNELLNQEPREVQGPDQVNPNVEPVENSERLKCSRYSLGLKNLHNSCFMNAVLHSLCALQPFAQHFLTMDSVNGRATPNFKQLVIEEVRTTFLELCRKDKKFAFSPVDLVELIRNIFPHFKGYRQQDAHEFLRVILDRLHAELLSLSPRSEPCTNVSDSSGNSFVNSLFRGVLQSELHCKKCQNSSMTDEVFFDLSLDVPDDLTGLRTHQLNDFLANFFQVEDLGKENQYRCPTCKACTESSKRYLIKNLPQILCFHFKRFRCRGRSGTKINSNVKFPINNLDMSPFVVPTIDNTVNNNRNSTYKLTAVINHLGVRLNAGHYTSYAAHDGCWHHLNDHIVKQCTESEVAGIQAYILFYERHQENE